MTAGYNVRLSFYSLNNDADDAIGGANITGTLLAENIFGRIEATSPEQMFLEQGLETDRLFTILTYYQASLKEADQIEVVQPYNHPYIGERFRVLGVQHSSHTSRRKYSIWNVSRSERAHGEPYQ